MPSHSDLQSSSEPEPEPAICGWLTLDIIEDAGDWSSLEGARGAIEGAVRALAAHMQFKSQSPAGVCIALSDETHVRRLNATYRGKDKATNVLSFPAGDDAQEPDARAVFLGDVVLILD
jgi:probable rRNA maturation factor